VSSAAGQPSWFCCASIFYMNCSIGHAQSCQPWAANTLKSWHALALCMSIPQATCFGHAMTGMVPNVKPAIAVYAVLKNSALVEHALRQTLAADALSLQFKLPPPSLPVPIAQSSDDIAGGTLVVDALAVTSVWAVQLLRMLCSVRQASSLTASVHADLLKFAWHDCQVPRTHTVRRVISPACTALCDPLQ